MDEGWYFQDIYEALEEREATRVKLISPVQFIRDRELGIRGVSDRFVRQGVEVESGLWNLFGERWTYTAKRRVFGRALKEICDISCYREADDESKCKYIEEIFEKVKLCEALYIQIPAGISRCIELIVIDNLRFPDFIHRKDQDVLTASLELAAEEEREL